MNLYTLKAVILLAFFIFLCAVMPYLFPILIVTFGISLWYTQRKQPNDIIVGIDPSAEVAVEYYYSFRKSYFASKAWKILRQKVLRRDNHKCQSCGRKDSLEVHHITYENFTNESLDELVTLCRYCHQDHHNHYGYPNKTNLTTFYAPLRK